MLGRITMTETSSPPAHATSPAQTTAATLHLNSLAAWVAMAMLSPALFCCTGTLSGGSNPDPGPSPDSSDAGTDQPPAPLPGSADAGSESPQPEPADAGSEPPLPPDAGEPLQWRSANLTNYTSYPDPGSEECIEYNGCEWAGWFAGLDEQQPESWVMANNIAAVHSDDFDTYRLKTLRLRQGTREIDVVVYDMCGDSDCGGCCTENSSETGFLIDIESYTAERFGSGDGIVEWVCLDCD
jgi:hypothetical protein